MLLLGCGKPTAPPLGPKDVKALICGNYEGRYNRGVEYFQIAPDGTFTQKLVQGGKTAYDHKGRWSFERMQDRYLVTFEPFMDLSDAITNGKSPAQIRGYVATFYDDEPRIYFSRDIDYFITKQSKKEP